LKPTRLNDVILVFNIKTFAQQLQNIRSFIDTGLGNVKPQLLIIQGYERLSYYIGREQLSDFPVLQFKGEPISQNIPYLKLIISSNLKINHNISNVVGMIEGKNKDKYILITAHYDGLGMFGDKVFPGAQDNAIGVAAMLDIANHFSKPENKPNYSIVFIAFAGEEIGRRGSIYFVQNPLITLGNIEIVLNLDLVGSGSGGLQI
jgi:hypothetical protein